MNTDGGRLHPTGIDRARRPVLDRFAAMDDGPRAADGQRQIWQVNGFRGLDMASPAQTSAATALARRQWQGRAITDPYLGRQDIDAIQARSIDTDARRCIGQRVVGVDAAYRTKVVMFPLRVPAIGAEHILAVQQLKIRFRDERNGSAAARAKRAIASDQRHGWALNRHLKPHRATVAGALKRLRHRPDLHRPHQGQAGSSSAPYAAAMVR